MEQDNRHRRLSPAQMLANAAQARRLARSANPGSYVQAQAITERRLWLIAARQQLSQRKGRAS